ncbi:ribosome hibernation-promoting factor, HPF/YfiA family [Weissella tructae]|uniref:Ribosome hibernation promoting factor n=2 Tax=Weissella TaxID=46255 RepID=A0A075TXY2_9LACO|nr:MULTISPECIES: ribosome-associated translation inhibitor RaiA [Weissella]AIG65070.1 Ribosomal subunit interface protein [Weissella tructae]AIM62382.1 Ribosomal subunit interface protein [Weissella ceti]AIM63720.1 Ribosomal subunit interface protein [Weissella ceti]ELA07946.1 ribosome-associated protein Y (PSrp-1) [Weissella ceti NC36]QVV91469.1 ribosome-associated translation inhibitor RaiA [Weissella tructae]
MLNYQVRGINFEVTEAIQEYVEKRVSKLERYFKDDADYTAHVKLTANKNKQFTVEVLIQTPYVLVRAEDTQEDLYQAIDFVVEKLERQVRKYKTKVNRKSREKGYKGLEFDVEDIDIEEPEDSLNIVRKKSVELKPMDPEEAVLQMELLQHDFYIFINAETDQPGVVYKRKDNKYALLDGEQ